MADESLKNKTVKGVIWSAMERLSVQAIFLAITIIMARILSPHDYGLIGLLAIFIEISQALVDSGFGQALIRKQNRTELDNNTMFYFNIVVSSFLYILLWFLAPFVSRFYDNALLCPVMRVISLGVIFNSFGLVQRALLTIKVDFKTQMRSSLIAAIISGIIGVWMAYSGYGIWAIVAQQLVNYGINTSVLWMLTNWRPRLIFSMNSLREMFSFGSKLVASSILNTIYNNIFQIIIGKVFSPSSLGHYTRAKQFADFPSANLAGIMQRVTFPVLCELQNDDGRLREAYIRTLRMIVFIIFPLMCGLAGTAHPLVSVILGEKWNFCATLLSIICFSFMWNPVHSLNLNLLQVKGRSDLFLKLEIYKKIIGILTIAVSIPFGVEAMCYSTIIHTIICLWLNTYYTRKLIGVGFIMHIKQIAPIFVVCIIMTFILFVFQMFIKDNVICLLISIIFGTTFYITLSYMLKFKEISELSSIIKNIRNR